MSKTYYAKNGQLAITPPEFTKIEVQSTGGFATVLQRTDVVEVDLVMGYTLNGKKLSPGTHQIILRGDAGLQVWAKNKLYINNTVFVLCPEADILGYSEILPPIAKRKPSRA